MESVEGLEDYKNAAEAQGVDCDLPAAEQVQSSGVEADPAPFTPVKGHVFGPYDTLILDAYEECDCSADIRLVTTSALYPLANDPANAPPKSRATSGSPKKPSRHRQPQGGWAPFTLVNRYAPVEDPDAVTTGWQPSQRLPSGCNALMELGPLNPCELPEFISLMERGFEAHSAAVRVVNIQITRAMRNCLLWLEIKFDGLPELNASAEPAQLKASLSDWRDVVAGLFKRYTADASVALNRIAHWDVKPICPLGPIETVTAAQSTCTLIDAARAGDYYSVRFRVFHVGCFESDLMISGETKPDRFEWEPKGEGLKAFRKRTKIVVQAVHRRALRLQTVELTRACEYGLWLLKDIKKLADRYGNIELIRFYCYQMLYTQQLLLAERLNDSREHDFEWQKEISYAETLDPSAMNVLRDYHTVLIELTSEPSGLFEALKCRDANEEWTQEVEEASAFLQNIRGDDSKVDTGAVAHLDSWRFDDRLCLSSKREAKLGGFVGTSLAALHQIREQDKRVFNQFDHRTKAFFARLEAVRVNNDDPNNPVFEIKDAVLNEQVRNAWMEPVYNDADPRYGEYPDGDMLFGKKLSRDHHSLSAVLESRNADEPEEQKRRGGSNGGDLNHQRDNLIYALGDPSLATLFITGITHTLRRVITLLPTSMVLDVFDAKNPLTILGHEVSQALAQRLKQFKEMHERYVKLGVKGHVSQDICDDISQVALKRSKYTTAAGAAGTLSSSERAKIVKDYWDLDVREIAAAFMEVQLFGFMHADRLRTEPGYSETPDPDCPPLRSFEACFLRGYLLARVSQNKRQTGTMVDQDLRQLRRMLIAMFVYHCVLTSADDLRYSVKRFDAWWQQIKSVIAQHVKRSAQRLKWDEPADRAEIELVMRLSEVFELHYWHRRPIDNSQAPVDGSNDLRRIKQPGEIYEANGEFRVPEPDEAKQLFEALSTVDLDVSGQEQGSAGEIFTPFKRFEHRMRTRLKEEWWVISLVARLLYSPLTQKRLRKLNQPTLRFLPEDVGHGAVWIDELNIPMVYPLIRNHGSWLTRDDAVQLGGYGAATAAIWAGMQPTIFSQRTNDDEKSNQGP